MRFLKLINKIDTLLDLHYNFNFKDDNYFVLFDILPFKDTLKNELRLAKTLLKLSPLIAFTNQITLSE